MFLEQVVFKIENLHVRFEDDFFCHPVSSPYSFGMQIKLAELNQTRDKFWSFRNLPKPTFEPV